MTERDVPYLITSSGEAIPADANTLKKRGWRLACTPTQYGNTPLWPLDDVRRFLEKPRQPVNPSQVYKEVVSPFVQYMDYGDDKTAQSPMYGFQALWLTGTYFHHLFTSYPYQYIGGTKGSGKTKTLTLLSCLCFNAVSSGSLTPACLFRLVQGLRCTLLIDETERLGVDKCRVVSESTREFRNLLLNGYKKGMPAHRVERNSMDQFQVGTFDVYGPKALANIGGLDDIMEDRCIPNFLITAKDAEKKNMEPDITDPRWSEVRSKLFRLYLDYWHEVKACYENLSELKGKNLVSFLHQICPEMDEKELASIAGRPLELWKPIICMARFFDLKDNTLQLTRLILKMALRNISQRLSQNITETDDMILIETLLEMVSKPGWTDDYVWIKDIRLNMLSRYDENPTWLSHTWVGCALRRLRLSNRRRLGSARQIRLSKRTITDLAIRYNIGSVQASLASQTSQVSQKSGSATSDTFHTCDTSLKNRQDQLAES